MASHVVIRQAVGFVYPAYKTLHAVMTEDHVIFIQPKITLTLSSLIQHQHHHLGAIFSLQYIA